MRQRKAIFVAAVTSALAAAAPAGAQTARANLSGFHENPSVSTNGSGKFKAKIDEKAGSIFWELEYSGMQADVIMSHIHLGQRHTNGGITVWLCQTATNPAPAAVAALTQTCPTRSASLNGTITAANVIATAATQQLPAGGFAQLLRAMRAHSTYANVHTTVSPGGEIRGQIRTSHDGEDDHEGKGKD